MDFSERMAEFEVCLDVYTKNSQGVVADTRDAMAKKYAAIGADQLASLGMEPADAAAIFSGCVGVRDITVLPRLRDIEGASELFDALEELRETGGLPHACQPGHPADRLFDELTTSVNGAVLYREVVLILADARESGEFKSLLFIPGSTRGVAQVPELITATAEQHEVVDVGSESNSLFDADDRDHGFDADNSDEEGGDGLEMFEGGEEDDE